MARHDKFEEQCPAPIFRRRGRAAVLIGLTPEETFEFERLDSESSLGQAGKQAARDGDTPWQAAGERRWLELYAKHEGAWKAWMAQSRAEAPGDFNLY